MTRYRYARPAILADYGRAGIGLVLTGTPLAMIGYSPVATSILGGLAAVFGAFAWRTWRRQRTVIELDQEGIAAATWPATLRLAWTEIDEVSLRYYSSRRGREGGWMQLGMSAKGRRLTLDSTLEGFDDIAARAAAAAGRNNLQLSSVTLGNLAALGIRHAPGEGIG